MNILLASNVGVWIAGGIILAANLITAITVIVSMIKKVNTTAEDKIRNIAREEQDKESARITETQSIFLKQLRETLFKALDDNFKIVGQEISGIRDDLNAFNKEQAKKNDILTLGHIETWKKDIRDIYFHLRNTGEIKDDNKAYVDKVYHVYKELGGNSDIDAKYKEICEVYARLTHKRYEELQNKNTTDTDN